MNFFPLFSDIQRVRNAYVTTLPHIAPYFTGLITGYILSKWNEFKIPMVSYYDSRVSYE